MYENNRFGRAALLATAFALATFQDCAAQEVVNVTIHVSSGTHSFRRVDDGKPREGADVWLGYYSQEFPPDTSLLLEDPAFTPLKLASTDAGGKVSFSFSGPVEKDAVNSNPQLAVFFDDTGTGTAGYIGLISDAWILEEGEIIVSIDNWTDSLGSKFSERCLPGYLYDGAQNAGFPFAASAAGESSASVTLTLKPSEGAAWTLGEAPNPDFEEGGKWIESGESAGVLPGPWTIEFKTIQVEGSDCELEHQAASVIIEPGEAFAGIFDYGAVEIVSGELTYRSRKNGGLKVEAEVVVGYYPGGAPPGPVFDGTLSGLVVIASGAVGEEGNHVALATCVDSAAAGMRIHVFFQDDLAGEYIGLSSPDWKLQPGQIRLDTWTQSFRSSFPDRTLQRYVYDGYNDNAGFPLAASDPGLAQGAPTLKVKLTPSIGSKWRFKTDRPEGLKPRWVESEEQVPVLYGPWVLEFMPVVGHQRPFPLSLDVAPGASSLDIAATYRTLPVPEVEIQQIGPDALRVGFVDRPQSDAYEIAWRGGAAPGVADMTFAKGQGEREELGEGRARFWFEVPSESLADGAQCFWIELVELR